jgi:prepilin-type N-terminal cleavage/methylation domain-containing protein
MRGTQSRARDGFTLVEVLVAAILVVLFVAAVYPVVLPQVDRGHPARTAERLAALGAAIERFSRDVPGAYPGDVEDLLSPISTADTGVTRAGARARFTPRDSAGWSGPYLDAPAAGLALTAYDAGGAAGVPGAPGLHLAVTLGSAAEPLTPARFEALNDLIDGEGEADGAGASTSWTLGRLRYHAADADRAPAGYYLAVPLVP